MSVRNREVHAAAYGDGLIPGAGSSLRRPALDLVSKALRGTRARTVRR